MRSRRQKEKEKAKKRISSRRVKKTAVDVSDLSNSEGDEVSNSEGEEVSNGEGDNDDGVECPVCHVRGLSCQWFCCDNCNVWYHTHCTDANPDSLPNMFYCLKCV